MKDDLGSQTFVVNEKVTTVLVIAVSSEWPKFFLLPFFVSLKDEKNRNKLKQTLSAHKV